MKGRRWKRSTITCQKATEKGKSRHHVGPPRPEKEGAKPEKPVQNGPGGGEAHFREGKEGGSGENQLLPQPPSPSLANGDGAGIRQSKKSRFFFKKVTKSDSNLFLLPLSLGIAVSQFGQTRLMHTPPTPSTPHSHTLQASSSSKP